MIVQNGVDVTMQIEARVSRHQQAERESVHYLNVVTYLARAKAELDAIPRPWQNDCVSEVLEQIDNALIALGGL